jgi:hypothetical protein
MLGTPNRLGRDQFSARFSSKVVVPGIIAVTSLRQLVHLCQQPRRNTSCVPFVMFCGSKPNMGHCLATGRIPLGLAEKECRLSARRPLQAAGTLTASKMLPVDTHMSRMVR